MLGKPRQGIVFSARAGGVVTQALHGVAGLRPQPLQFRQRGQFDAASGNTGLSGRIDHQAVRLLHREGGADGGVGSFTLPAEEPVRFTSNPSLAFPAGEIQDLDVEPDGQSVSAAHAAAHELLPEARV